MMWKRISLFVLFFFSIATAFCQHPVEQNARFRVDSLIQYDRGLEYMKNIDSLLRAANLKADSLARLQYQQKMHRAPQRSILSSVLANPALRLIFWIAAVVFFIFIVYRLFSLKSFLSGKPDIPSTEEESNGDFKTAGWYRGRIQEAEDGGDYRTATRYLFMTQLIRLSEKDVLHLVPEKTNTDYIREIKDLRLRSDFKELSRVYEYVWYGNRPVGKDQYHQIKDMFTQSLSDNR